MLNISVFKDEVVMGFIRRSRKIDIPLPLLREVALFVKGQILKRTASGVDYMGVTFHRYSEKYALFRKKRGRQDHPPNLYYNGTMLRSIRFRPVGSRVGNLFFNSTKSTNKAKWNNFGTSRIPRREFFKKGPADNARIDEIISDYLKDNR